MRIKKYKFLMMFACMFGVLLVFSCNAIYGGKKCGLSEQEYNEIANKFQEKQQIDLYYGTWELREIVFLTFYKKIDLKDLSRMQNSIIIEKNGFSALGDELITDPVYEFKTYLTTAFNDRIRLSKIFSGHLDWKFMPERKFITTIQVTHKAPAGYTSCIIEILPDKRLLIMMGSFAAIYEKTK